MERIDDLGNFTQALLKVGLIYQQAISPELIELYWQALKDFAWVEVDAAFKLHINNPKVGQYFPKPGDVVRVINHSLEQKAAEAWIEVHQAISKIGSYQSVAFANVVINLVVEKLGGWVSLCLTPLAELPSKARDFKRLYRQFTNKPANYYPAYCAGLQQDNEIVMLVADGHSKIIKKQELICAQ